MDKEQAELMLQKVKAGILMLTEIQKDLENAKKDLKDKQEKLQWFMEHEINSERFEYNMITVLTEMTGLKKKIKTLEFYLSYK